MFDDPEKEGIDYYGDLNLHGLLDRFEEQCMNFGESRALGDGRFMGIEQNIRITREYILDHRYNMPNIEAKLLSLRVSCEFRGKFRAEFKPKGECPKNPHSGPVDMELAQAVQNSMKMKDDIVKRKP